MILIMILIYHLMNVTTGNITNWAFSLNAVICKPKENLTPGVQCQPMTTTIVFPYGVAREVPSGCEVRCIDWRNSLTSNSPSRSKINKNLIKLFSKRTISYCIVVTFYVFVFLFIVFFFLEITSLFGILNNEIESTNNFSNLQKSPISVISDAKTGIHC